MTDVSLLRTEAAAAARSAARDAAAPVLALPEGWVIDELVRDRLSHQLTRRRPMRSPALSPKAVRSRSAPAIGFTPNGSACAHSPRRLELAIAHCEEPLFCGLGLRSNFATGASKSSRDRC